jgi:integrase
MKLDAKTVDALILPYGKTDIIVFDDVMPRFGYRLRQDTPTRPLLRSWVVQYKRAGGTRRIRLGSAEVLNAEQARAAAKKVLAKVDLGEDPQADRQDRRDKDKLTLRAVVDEYLAYKARKVRPKTLHETARYLTGYAFKPLHGMAIDTVSRRDIASRLATIIRERSDIVAVTARATLSAFFTWAMQMGYVEFNPVVGTIQPENGKPRERVLSDDELGAIWRACRDDDYGRIVKLLILTGARRAEIGGIRWSEIDLENGRWRLPAERSKNGRAHELPLMPAALSIIRSVDRMLTRDQLFGAHSAIGFANFGEHKPALDARSGVTRWTVHDIRRSVATRMADIGIQPHIIEAVLNHVSGHKAGVAGIYNRSPYEREVHGALATWAEHVRATVEGGERKVVQFKA